MQIGAFRHKPARVTKSPPCESIAHMAVRAALPAFLFTFCSQLAAGQDVLTLDRAVRDALEHSRALSAARAGADEAAAREDVARAERRRDAGTVTEADVLSLAVHVADLRQRTIQADGDAAILRAQLNRLMGAPVNGRFSVQE